MKSSNLKKGLGIAAFYLASGIYSAFAGGIPEMYNDLFESSEYKGKINGVPVYVFESGSANFIFLDIDGNGQLNLGESPDSFGDIGIIQNLSSKDPNGKLFNSSLDGNLDGKSDLALPNVSPRSSLSDILDDSLVDASIKVSKMNFGLSE